MANQLAAAKRVKILHLLLEGMAMRAICRVEKVNWRTVDKLLKDAAKTARRYHEKRIQDISVNAVQCDELWSFCYAKQKKAKKVKPIAGDVWTWVALEPDTKLLLAYRIDSRTDAACRRFTKDLESRLDYDEDLTISTDGNQSYVKAFSHRFGRRIKYLQMVKTHTANELLIKYRQVFGSHVVDKASTSYIERANLTFRMHNRRYSRKTNAFSKSIDNHKNMVDLFVLYYNFIRVHETLGTTPAVAAQVVRRPRSLEWLVAKIDRQQARRRQRMRNRVRLPVK